MRFKTRRALVSLLLTYVVSLPASAGIMSVTPNDNGNGSITVGTTSEFNVQLDKVYDSIGPMQIDITVDSDGTYFLDEVIINQTGIPWTDFHWDLGGETDGTFSLLFFNTTVFLERVLGQTSLDVFNGVVADGNSFQPSIGFEVFGSTEGGAFLTLTQFPTIDATIPEPTTFALLGLGLAGLGFARRRRVHR